MMGMRMAWGALAAGAIALTGMAGAALAQGGRDAGVDVTSYALSLAPDLASKSVVGREKIRLRATRDGLSRAAFSANALTIDSATIDGAAVAHAVHDGKIEFALPRQLASGRSVTLVIRYHGTPARGLARSATGLYSSYFACDWMICEQDAFGDKAAFSIDLQVPAGMETLSVGRRIATSAGPGGSEIHRWRAPRPYSAYLYGFAVGRFARATDRRGAVRLDYLSDVAATDVLKRRFGATPDMLRFLSDKAGTHFPVAEYSQMLVDGDEAQEAATYAVIGSDALPAEADDAVSDWAIVHELSHQYWGNLVTCATLTDFWLNEGVATFMTAAWKEHRYGRAAYDAELGVARKRLAKARAMGFDKPLAWAGTYPSLGVRRAVQYSKGALFMDQLRSTLGEAAFWSGLRDYTRRHAGGTVTSGDLQRAMEQASKRDLHGLFDQWVFGAGDVASGTKARE